MPATDLVSFNDRQIDSWGNTVLTPAQFVSACVGGKQINERVYVTEIDHEIRQYNRFAATKIKTYDSYQVGIDSSAYQWKIPQSYQELDLRSLITERLAIECSNTQLDEEQIQQRVQRVQLELKLVNKHDLTDLFRTLVYVVDRMSETNTVWGMGRGSSVACYLLYLIGVHDVDSVHYDIDPLEFFKTK